jgi:hypothetical protein
MVQRNRQSSQCRLFEQLMNSNAWKHNHNRGKGGGGEFSIEANNQHVWECPNYSVHRPKTAMIRTANGTPPKERLNSIDVKNKAG